MNRKLMEMFFKSLIKLSLLMIAFIAGTYLGGSKVFKEDAVHVLLSSKLNSKDEWKVSFCGKIFDLKEQVFISRFDCEGAMYIKKNDHAIDEIYITGGYDYYILINNIDNDEPATINVLLK